MRTLYDPSLQFFKGNLHMHTTLSDGRLSPEEALNSYRAKGYDFVALTDHWRPHESADFMGMTVLSGVELDTWADEDQVVHIVGVGFDADKLDLSCRDFGAQALVDRIRAANGAAILAHPAWSMNTVEFINSLHDISGAEIFNTFSGIPWNAGRADSSQILDLAAVKGAPLPLVACDDSHRYGGEEGVSATVVNASDASRESLMDAILAGRFYASQGPAFHQVSIDGRDVLVECSPCDRIIFYSNLQWSSKRCVNGRDMTSAYYQMDERERTVRIELIDRFGRRAWSSPVAV